MLVALLPVSLIRLSMTWPEPEPGSPHSRSRRGKRAKPGGDEVGLLPAPKRGGAFQSVLFSSPDGGDSGSRTRNLRLAKPALCQLSYIPGSGSAFTVVGTGAQERWWA